jgi:predicted Ser/Thr protein kinase
MFRGLNEDAQDALHLPYKSAPGYTLRKYKIFDNLLVWFVFIAVSCFLYALAPLVATTAPSLWPSIFFFLICAYLSVKIRRDAIYFDRKIGFLPGSTTRFGKLVSYLTFGTMSFAIPVTWARLAEIEIVDKAKGGKAKQFVLRLVTLHARGSFRIDFDLPLRSLERESLPDLAAHLERYASHARGIYLLKELERFHDYQMGHLPEVSYTELWESSSKSAFSLTSFNPLAAGTKIQNGAYTVEKQVAAGGFSAVYTIVSASGERYVLKESCLPLSLSPANRMKALEQFKREALILAKLNHPQIAQVYDYFTENDRNYLRLEFVEGETLRSFVSKRRGQKETIVLDWFRQIAEILVYLHELELPVVHRDLAPDNIIVRENGRLELIDFGAANEFVGGATGTLVGRHAYMSTEQIRGKAEPRSDIYSLGATMFYCLTNREPLPLRSSSPRSAGYDVSEKIELLISKCTRLEPSERFASARELLCAIDSTASDRHGVLGSEQKVL